MTAARKELPRLAPRNPESHKGDYGRVLIVGGSRGMAGAVALAGMAALRGGAGLVKIATADCCLETVASFEPSYMTVGLPCDDAGRISNNARDKLTRLALTQTCLACGPGLGQSHSLDDLVVWMYESIEMPMVFDADGLNALAAHRHVLGSPGGQRILTPHPGEFQRLTGEKSTSRDMQQDAAHALAKKCGVVIVLKGHQSLVTDGNSSFLNNTGNPGMATGGTGDVLTGLTAALLGQGLTPFDAACLAVHVHGRAGDLAAAELGQPSVIARDLIRFLPIALRTQAG